MAEVSRRAFLLGCAAVPSMVAANGVRAQPPAGDPVIDALSAPARKAVGAVVTNYLREHGLPGISLAVARSGKRVYARGFGVADTASGAAVTPAHLFRIADISKPFTAVMLFALIEKGKLRLTDKVFGDGGILQADFGAQARGRFLGDLTVDHLVSHTAGGWAAAAADPMLLRPELNQDQLVAWVLENVPLTRAPGTAFAYSNFSYCLLGRVIEKATHAYYATLMRDLVFHPCGITQMRMAGNTPALRAPEEVVYGGPDEGAYALNVTRMDASGGWLASAGDLVRFAVHADGVYAPALLQPASRAQMTAPLALHPAFARGWEVDGRNRFHTGSLPGTSALLVRTPGGLCYAALANGRNSRTGSVPALAQMMKDVVKAAQGFG